MKRVASILCIFIFTESASTSDPSHQARFEQVSIYEDVTLPVDDWQRFMPGDKVDVLAGWQTNDGHKVGKVVVQGATVIASYPAARIVRIRLKKKEAELIRQEQRNRIIFVMEDESLRRRAPLPADPFRAAVSG